MTEVATSADETPVFFPAGGEELFGIFTRPTTEPLGIAVMLLSGGAWTPSPGRNRIWVRLARQLAAKGFHVMRMDYRGVGESTGAITNYPLDDPFVDDVEGAVRWMEGQGVSDFVLAGTCFGGRAALAAASRVDGLRGVAMFGSPVRDFPMRERLATLPLSWYLRKALTRRAVRGLFDRTTRQQYLAVLGRKARRAAALVRRADGRSGDAPRRFQWVSPIVLDQLRQLVERQVPVLLVYGEEDDFYADLLRGQSGPVGELLDRAGSLVTLVVVEEKVHGLRTSRVQDHVVRHTQGWLSGLAASDRHPTPATP